MLLLELNLSTNQAKEQMAPQKLNSWNRYMNPSTATMSRLAEENESYLTLRILHLFNCYYRHKHTTTATSRPIYRNCQSDLKLQSMASCLQIDVLNCSSNWKDRLLYALHNQGSIRMLPSYLTMDKGTFFFFKEVVTPPGMKKIFFMYHWGDLSSRYEGLIQRLIMSHELDEKLRLEQTSAFLFHSSGFNIPLLRSENNNVPSYIGTHISYSVVVGSQCGTIKQKSLLLHLATLNLTRYCWS